MISDRFSDTWANVRISPIAATPHACVRITRRTISSFSPVSVCRRWMPRRSAAKIQVGRKTSSRCAYSPAATGGLSVGTRPTSAACATRDSSIAARTTRMSCSRTVRLERSVARHAGAFAGIAAVAAEGRQHAAQQPEQGVRRREFQEVVEEAMHEVRGQAGAAPAASRPAADAAPCCAERAPAGAPRSRR